MIEIEPMTSQHILDLLAGGVLECGARAARITPELAEVARQKAESAGSLTALENGRPLFCAILSILWPGVAEVSALLSVAFSQHKIEGCRAARDIMARFIEEHRLHRVQTTVRCDFPAGVQFAEWLGFRVEGIAQQYGHDRVNSFYYAWVR